MDILEAYRLFEIPRNSTFKEIRNKYLSLVKQYHPDQNEIDTTEKFKQIETAYRILSKNSEFRKETKTTEPKYDKPESKPDKPKPNTKPKNKEPNSEPKPEPKQKQKFKKGQNLDDFLNELMKEGMKKTTKKKNRWES